MRDVLAEEEWRRIGRQFGFTPRELQVVKILFDSKSEEQIAAELGIKPGTVHKHLEKLRMKTGTTDRLSLALFLVRTARQFRGEIPPPDDPHPGPGQPDDPE